jgi:hypothetical protein
MRSQRLDSSLTIRQLLIIIGKYEMPIIDEKKIKLKNGVIVKR